MFQLIPKSGTATSSLGLIFERRHWTLPRHPLFKKRQKGNANKMKITSVSIKNFKGIQHLTIDLNGNPKSNIFCLVGLNESGKTTILEAINHFAEKSDSLDPFSSFLERKTDYSTLIPISKHANFSDRITFEITFVLSESEEDAIKTFGKQELGFKFTNFGRTIVVSHTLVFKDSKYDARSSQVRWTWVRTGRYPNQKKDTQLIGEHWVKLVKFTKTLFPNIVYFPTSLLDFPERIYLEDKEKENNKKHAFYRSVIQDILDALNLDLNIHTHILVRAKSNLSLDRSHLENVLQKMSKNVSTIVFGSWNKVFKQSTGTRSVRIKCEKDEDGAVYISFLLESDDGIYKINERSLGFRWFFSFLLLTQYRGYRSSDSPAVLFLLDEPAANLHASAQSQLLKSFENLGPNCSMMYTTHSPHLINPEWLENTFIVKNEAFDTLDELGDVSSEATNVTVQKYRNFATNHPNQTSYFQPILDVLQYYPARLENVPATIMVEGKNDFYTFKYVWEIICSCEPLNLAPGTGSGTLDTLIQLYMAWNRSFCIILDSDAAGQKEKKRYVDKFGPLTQDKIFVLSDIEQEWKSGAIESLFTAAEVLEIQRIAYPHDKAFSKTHFSRAVQELLVNKSAIALEPQTKANFLKIYDFLRQKVA